MTPVQTIADIVLKVLANLPMLQGLAPGAVALVQGIIASWRALRDNPNATMADIDALIAKTVAQSAQIQAQK